MLFVAELRHVIRKQMVYMSRAEAEIDEEYLQPITYAIVVADDKVFCTKRLKGGDERLKGLCSIGTGGHVDEGETLESTLYRELEEEIGVTNDMIKHCRLMGYIHDRNNAVGRVHIGLVYLVKIDEKQMPNIAVREKDKLSGMWINRDEMVEIYENGQFESWTEHILKRIGGVI
jgi:predicted NUDIX family phosphoesterase